MNTGIHLTQIDWSVIIASLLVTMLISIYAKLIKKKSGTKNSLFEYLIMSRQMTLPGLVMTLTATWYGDILGVSQIGVQHGIFGFISQGLVWYIAYLFFALVWLKKIWSLDVYSMPELIGRTIGKPYRYIAAILIYIKTLPVTYGLSLALIIQTFSGLDIIYSLIIGFGIIYAYSLFSGLRGVAYTDYWQFTLMITSLLLINIFSIYNNNFKLISTLPEHYFTLSGQHDLSAIFIWFIFASLAVFLNPAFYLRCQAVKSYKIAKTGILISIIFWIIIDTSICLTALCAAASKIGNIKTSFLLYSLDILPKNIGLQGFFVAGMLASLFSTMDAYLHGATSLFYTELNISSKKNYIYLFFTSALTVYICYLIYYSNINYEQFKFFIKSLQLYLIALPLLIIVTFNRIFRLAGKEAT